MKAEQKLARGRLSVLELAEALGNVSEACRRRGVSRTQFYEYKRRFQTHGIEGLIDLPPVHKSHPMSTSEEVQQKIVQMSLSHPAWGCNRISDQLKLQSVSVSAPTVQNILNKKGVDSTGRCNTVGFGCCLDRRCASGEAGLSRRVVRSEQKGAVGAVEGRGVYKRHRPGITQGPRLHSRDARSHRRLLSTRAAQAKMRAHPGRAGRDLPRTRQRRIPSCNRRPARPLCLHRVPGGEPQRWSQKLPGPESRGAGLKAHSASQEVPARDRRATAGCGSTEAAGRLVARADLRLAQKRVS